MERFALDKTPFYAEAGGQAGDTGVLLSKATGEPVAVVESPMRVLRKSVHKVKLIGQVKEGDTVIARVDAPARHTTMRNHTGTHLLHAALRTVWATHVKQAGSVVEPSRLRFDFTHYTALDPDELAEVERLMNEQILANREVTTKRHGPRSGVADGCDGGCSVRSTAIRSGCLDYRFFERALRGTHVERTGDIGICKNRLRRLYLIRCPAH